MLEAASRFDVMLLGPGLGSGQRSFVESLLLGWQGPMVLDADGLNAVNGIDVLSDRAAPTVLTPHAGEATRLIGSSDLEAMSRLPDDAGVIVVLKGNPTFILGSERWVVRSGGSELATIGTGDVLGGAIAALWSRGLSGDVAARSGAYWHGVAGSELGGKGAFSASDLAAAIRGYAFGRREYVRFAHSE